MKSREEQLSWAKQRALICVDMGDFSDAVAGCRSLSRASAAAAFIFVPGTHRRRVVALKPFRQIVGDQLSFLLCRLGHQETSEGREVCADRTAANLQGAKGSNGDGSGV